MCFGSIDGGIAVSLLEVNFIIFQLLQTLRRNLNLQPPLHFVTSTVAAEGSPTDDTVNNATKIHMKPMLKMGEKGYMKRFRNKIQHDMVIAICVNHSFRNASGLLQELK